MKKTTVNQKVCMTSPRLLWRSKGMTTVGRMSWCEQRLNPAMIGQESRFDRVGHFLWYRTSTVTILMSFGRTYGTIFLPTPSRRLLTQDNSASHDNYITLKQKWSFSKSLHWKGVSDLQKISTAVFEAIPTKSFTSSHVTWICWYIDSCHIYAVSYVSMSYAPNITCIHATYMQCHVHAVSRVCSVTWFQEQS